MKKLICLLIVCVAIVGTAVCADALSSGYAQVSAEESVNLGQTITFTVRIAEEQPVLAVMVEPTYDPQSFELVDGTMLQSGIMADFSDGNGVIAWAEPTDPNGDVMQFTLKPKNTVRPGSGFVIGCSYSFRDSQDQLQYGTAVGSYVTVDCQHSYTDGSCVYCGRAEFAAQVNGVRYSTVQQAVDHAGEQYVQLLDDCPEHVISSGSLCLDLNGYVLQELTVNGVLYGMDSSTADYDCADGYGYIEKLNGTCVQLHTAGAFQRYVTVTTDLGISFHRIYVGVTHMSLRTQRMDLGYKVAFYADQVIREHMTCYGVELWADSENKRDTAYTEFVAGPQGNIKSVRIKNVLSTIYDDEINAAAAVTDVTACGYAVLELDGKQLRIESNPVTGDLRDMLAVVNGSVDRYSAAQLLNLQRLIATYEGALQKAGCAVDNIVSWTE